MDQVIPPNKKLNIHEFVEKYNPKVSVKASLVKKKFRNLVEFDDLCGVGRLFIVELYRNDRIDWERTEKEINAYVLKRVEGIMLNAAGYVVKKKKMVSSVGEIFNEELTSVKDVDDITQTMKPKNQKDEISGRQILLQKHLFEFLDNLDSQDRFIFISKILDGKTNSDIGRLLKTSRTTVGKKYWAVISRLKRYLVKTKRWSEEEIKDMIPEPTTKLKNSAS